MMTNADQAEAEALTITVHSRAATDTEILTTEFIACYLTANMAWNYDSDHQELKKASTGTKRSLSRQLTEDNDLGCKSPMRGLPIRLVSIHGQDIRILTTYFTEEYYQSFRKADQSFKIADQSFKNADQSTSSNLHGCIESFRLPDDWDPRINYVIQKLTDTSSKQWDDR